MDRPGRIVGQVLKVSRKNGIERRDKDAPSVGPS